MKKFLFIILFLALFFHEISCKKDFQKENEPNNDFITANKIEPDIAIQGSLDTSGDHDIYRLDIMIPIVIDIELSPVKGVNHAIKIWKGRKDKEITLKYIDDARKSSPERMNNMYFDNDTYYIEILHGDRDVAQGNKKNDYQLRLTSRDLNEEEMESNDDNENANHIEIGSEIKGYFSPSFNKLNQEINFRNREEDWYYFNIDLVNEEPVLLDTNLSGVPDVNTILYIYDSDKSEIASADHGGTGEREYLEGIGIRKTGKYYIVVASHFESNNNIPYSLVTKSRNFDFSSEIELNNNFDSANLILKDEITGRISPEGDKDYFIFDRRKIDEAYTENKIKPGEQLLYRIEAGSADLDLLLRIYDGNKKNLFEIDNFKNPGTEIMPNAFFKNNFYIEVSAKKGESPGKEYKLGVHYFPYSENYEIEPNDAKEKATRVKSNKITGFVSTKNDKDFYFLEYKKRVRKKITFNGIKDSELKVSVTDPLGFIIRTESIKGAEPVSFTEMIDLRGYLIVEAVTENYNDAYTIELGD